MPLPSLSSQVESSPGLHFLLQRSQEFHSGFKARRKHSCPAFSRPGCQEQRSINGDSLEQFASESLHHRKVVGVKMQ